MTNPNFEQHHLNLVRSCFNLVQMLMISFVVYDLPKISVSPLSIPGDVLALQIHGQNNYACMQITVHQYSFSPVSFSMHQSLQQFFLKKRNHFKLHSRKYFCVFVQKFTLENFSLVFAYHLVPNDRKKVHAKVEDPRFHTLIQKPRLQTHYQIIPCTVMKENIGTLTP